MRGVETAGRRSGSSGGGGYRPRRQWRPALLVLLYLQTVALCYLASFRTFRARLAKASYESGLPPDWEIVFSRYGEEPAARAGYFFPAGDRDDGFLPLLLFCALLLLTSAAFYAALRRAARRRG